MKTVLAFGTFDVLHPGHLSYLRQAKTMGDRLVVVLARDVSVRKGKGRAPLFCEKDRKILLEAVRYVDQVILGSTDDHFAVIEHVRPDVICLGYDHALTPRKLRARCVERGVPLPLIRRASSFKPARYKSHLLKNILTE